MADEMGVGLIGPGWVASEHIRAFNKNPHTRMVAVCSRDLSRAQGAIDEFDLDAKPYTDYEKMLADPDVDIVSICTPNFAHAEQGALAAEANKHLVIEKPIAISVEQLDRLVTAVKKGRR